MHIAAARLDTPFTHALVTAGAPLRMPIAHGEGCYFADDATLDALEADGRVLFRYVDASGARRGDDDRTANPNGSLRAIAGVLNAAWQRRRPDAPPGARRGIRSSARTTGPRSSARWSRARPGRRSSHGRLRRSPDDDRRGSGGAARTAPSPPRHHRRRAGRHPRPPGRPRAERPRARDVQRHVERALLLQELEAAPAHPAYRGRRRGGRSGRERGCHLDRRRTRRRVQDRIA